MKAILTFVTLLISTLSFSQTFEKVYYNTTNVEAQAIVHSDQNGIVIAGKQDSDAIIFRIDDQGEILWQAGFENPVNLYPNIDFFEVVPVADSNFILAGRVSNINTGKLNCLLMKIDKNGNLLWHKEYDNSALHSAVHGSVVEMADLGYLIAWGSHTGGTGWSMTRTDIDGNLIWTKSYSAGQPLLITDLEKLTDSTFVVISNLDESTAPYYSGLINTIDENGTILTSKKYTGLFFDDAAINGNVMAVCGKNTADGYYQFYTIADHQGNFSWNRTPGWGNASNLMDNYAHVVRRNDSSFVVYMGQDLWSGTAHAFNLNGNLTHSLTLHPIQKDLMATQDEGIVFIGGGPIYGIKALSNLHIGAIRVDSNFTTGNCAWHDALSQSDLIMPQVDTFSFAVANPPTIESVNIYPFTFSLMDSSRCIEMLGSVEENELELNVSVYPTITSESITVEFTDFDQLSFTIYAANGAIVMEESDVHSREQISLKGLENGVYIFRAKSQNGRQKTGKIILNQ